MRLLRTLAEAGTASGGVLVPTMGALHAGHARLIERAATEARARGLKAGAVVTIFVNPAQFNDPADFERYPRALDADLEVCSAAGASAVFAPDVETVYPPGPRRPDVPVPDVGRLPGLEDAYRPGHFAGVCSVVVRLFEMVSPSAAIFGEKDWQQFQVVRALTAHFGLAIDILPEPTVREPDGLAMSSRNAHLSSADRRRAAALSRALRRAQVAETPALAEQAMAVELAHDGITPDYAVVRDAGTLLRPVSGRPCRALVAATIGTPRLIDNMAWPEAAA
jgi:pantoate--beta-alanine ligase